MNQFYLDIKGPIVYCILVSLNYILIEKWMQISLYNTKYIFHVNSGVCHQLGISHLWDTATFVIVNKMKTISNKLVYYSPFFSETLLVFSSVQILYNIFHKDHCFLKVECYRGKNTCSKKIKH